MSAGYPNHGYHSQDYYNQYQDPYVHGNQGYPRHEVYQVPQHGGPNYPPPPQGTGKPTTTFEVVNPSKDLPKTCGCMTPKAVCVFTTLFIILCVALAIVMGVLGWFQIQKGPTVGQYYEVECMVYDLRYDLESSITCGSQTYSYECWKVIVQYQEPGGIYKVEKILKPTDEAVGNKFSRCSVAPSCGSSADGRKKTVDDFIDNYGVEGKTFTCYPHQSSAYASVETPPGPRNLYMILVFVIPSVIILICVAAIIGMCVSQGGGATFCKNYKRQLKGDYEVRKGIIELGRAVQRGDAVAIYPEHR